MQLDFSHAGVSKAELQSSFEKLKPYLAQLRAIVKKRDWSAPECSLLLPDDEETLAQSLSVLKKKKGAQAKYIVVIGIGGSNLGAKAVYDALCGPYDLLRPDRFPKCLFADTTDAEWLEAFDHFLRHHVATPEEVLLIAISKSGTTTETIANLDLILEAGTRRFASLMDRIIVITQEGSKFMGLAAGEHIASVGMSPCVGGRYSVFSSVGLVPLAAAGLDIKGFRRGAAAMREMCLASNMRNPAVATAATLAARKKKGSVIHDTFVFHPELESCGKWYRQLLAESLGKEKDIRGKTVHQGLLPTVSVGSIDLHSVGQLYLGGPHNIFTSFLWSPSSARGNQIGYSQFSSLVEGIGGASAADIMSAILGGTKRAYAQKKRPFLDVTLDDISAESIGAWMQYQMITVMLLGNLFGVNAFNQPEVELYKKETREILKSRRSE